MRIIKANTYEELSKIVAGIIVNQVNEKPDGVLGLATGSSPVGAYKEIIDIYNQGKVDFKNIKTVNLDEYRGLPKDDDQSYLHFMNVNLFNHVNINHDNTNIPDGMTEDIYGECQKYEDIIKSLGGIDLQLLGIGHNGHIGFNEPASDFARMTHCVDLDQRTIEANARFFDSVDDVPKQAFTMGIGTIMSAKKILLVATGESKADVLLETLVGEVRADVPSTILQFHHDVTIVADQKALTKVIETGFVCE